MVQNFHTDKPRYFQIQHDNALDAIIPFIETVVPLNQDMKVLEIGCGEGGVLAAFVDRQLSGVGVEIGRARSRLAEGFLENSISTGQARIINKDVFEVSIESDFRTLFDVIVLKDVIEHIDDHEQLMHLLKTFLAPGGHVFFGFPPWQMPFGGHQQMARSFLAKTPWVHLLPSLWWKGLLKLSGESPNTIKELMDIHRTGISLEGFEALADSAEYTVVHRELYFINPIFKYKFNLRPRRLWRVLAAIPWIRNFYTTGAYYLLGVGVGTGSTSEVGALESCKEPGHGAGEFGPRASSRQAL